MDVDSFFAHRKGSTKKRASGPKTIPKRQPFISVRGVRPPSDKSARGWQKNPAYTTYAPEIGRGAILSQKQIKRIIRDNVNGVDSANPTGVAMFSGLLDMGLTEAIDIANDIVRQARQQGVTSKTFGHAAHVAIAQAHPQAGRFMSATPNDDTKAYFEHRSEIGKKRYAKTSQLASFKQGTKIRAVYSNAPAIEKRFWKDLKAALKHTGESGLKRDEYPKINVTNEIEDLVATGSNTDKILQKIYGENYAKGNATYSLVGLTPQQEPNFIGIMSLYFWIGAASKFNHGDTMCFVILLNNVPADEVTGDVRTLLAAEKPVLIRKIERLRAQIVKYRDGTMPAASKATFAKTMVRNRTLCLLVARTEGYGKKASHASVVAGSEFAGFINTIQYATVAEEDINTCTKVMGML